MPKKDLPNESLVPPEEAAAAREAVAGAVQRAMLDAESSLKVEPDSDTIPSRDARPTFVHDSAHKHRPIGFGIEDLVQAPFTDDQVANILAFQHSGIGAIRCGNPHRGHDLTTPSLKGAGVPNDDRLVPTTDGLSCPLCGYRIEHVLHIIADGSAHKAVSGARDKHRKARGLAV